jgi:hypothetical protein
MYGVQTERETKHETCILFLRFFNPFYAERLIKRRAVSPLKMKIPNKNMREKPTNTPIIYSVY